MGGYEGREVAAAHTNHRSFRCHHGISDTLTSDRLSHHFQLLSGESAGFVSKGKGAGEVGGGADRLE